MAKQQFERQLEVAAFLVKCSVRAAIRMLHMASFVTSRLQVFRNRYLSSIFHIYWLNRKSTEAVLRRAEIEPVEIRIRRQKWAWIGHSLCKDEDSIAGMAMEWKLFDGLRRAPGEQCQT